MFLLRKLPWNCKIIHSIKTSNDLSAFSLSTDPPSNHALPVLSFLHPLSLSLSVSLIHFILSFISHSSSHFVSAAASLFQCSPLQQQNIKMRFDESVIRLPVFCPLSPFSRRLLVLKAKKKCACGYVYVLMIMRKGLRGGLKYKLSSSFTKTFTSLL